ncbi:hypothetical protein DFA_07257 [Cavenderia fasciculata]|uniref:Haloacid dehalogenase-like hydrolase domain-containing protein n=1 Tax=Cavenderia fasciculata TaxID=261658 RepID=F4PVX3_CACFS|nr:uncharacterized protein DFA_07257 [Cavenderia fasciculata]EGG20137.1 hypothetical protein DFA_07257 [Cavenderia fasciculata]|eukprot:XP_004367120.1 hypothetical protein DFA_07257 [Cavenderia fasciculata]
MWKVISLDATGTLFKVRGTTGFHYNKVLNNYGLYLKDDIVSKNFLKVFSDLSKEQPCFGHSKEQKDISFSMSRIKTDNSNVVGTTSHHTVGGEKWWFDLIKLVLLKSIDPNDEKASRLVKNLPDQAYMELYKRFEGKSGGVPSMVSGHHDCWEVYPEVVETLEELQKRKKYLSVISNFDERIFSILQDLDLIKYFCIKNQRSKLFNNNQNNHQNNNNEYYINKSNNLINSSESSNCNNNNSIPPNYLITTSLNSGYQKPHWNIFEHGFNQINKEIDPSLTKEEIVYVGDSDQKDYQGATNYGFSALLLDRYGKHPQHPNRISTLKEILPLLKD